MKKVNLELTEAEVAALIEGLSALAEIHPPDTIIRANTKRNTTALIKKIREQAHQWK